MGASTASRHQGAQARLSREAGDRAARPVRPVLGDSLANTVFTALTQSDEAFQQPTPMGATPVDIGYEINPHYKVERTGAVSEKGAVQSWSIRAPSGKKAYLYEGRPDKTYGAQGKPRIWIDVSDFTPGVDKGNVVYGIASAYAYNTGKSFVGDPEGLSPIGFFRRLENMLSSALRYGTTDHLAPHPHQIDPASGYAASVRNHDLGLKWKDGDYAHNLAEMLRVTNAAMRRFAPELEGLTYDFERNEYRDGRTGWHGDRRSLEKKVAGIGRDPTSRYRWGGATAARAAIFNTVLQEAGAGRGAGLLAAIGGQLSGRLNPNLRRVFYSRTDGDAAASEPALLPNLTARLADNLVARVDNLAAQGGKRGTLAEVLRYGGRLAREAVQKSWTNLAFTSAIVRRAADMGLTAATEWVGYVNERSSAALRHEEQVVNLIRDVSALDSFGDLASKGAAKANAVWEFVRDATMSQRVFKAYDWLPVDVVVKLDAEMAARYSALPAPSRAMVDRIFQQSRDTRERVFQLAGKAIQDALDSGRRNLEEGLPARIREAQARVQRRYDRQEAAIGDALREGDESLAAELESALWDEDTLAEKLDQAEDAARKLVADQIAELESVAKEQEKALSATRRRLPLYAPLRRVGDYAAIARSKTYEEAKAAGNTELVTRLQQSGQHYWVNFYSSMPDAERARDALRRRPEFAGGKVEAFEREKFMDSLDALPFEAFRKMEDAIRSDENRASTQADTLRLLRELYITSLADTSARKSELPRQGVHGMDAESMRQAYAAQGSADARYMATLVVGQKERDAFVAMRNQANADRSLMPLFNALKAREAAVLERPNALAGSLLKFNSWMRLVLNPAYYFYNLTQPALMTQPYLSREFGWTKSSAALARALGDVWNTQKGAKGIAHRIRAFADASLLPRVYRASERATAAEEGRAPMTIIEELAARGKIDITIAQDLGVMTQTSGLLTRAAPRVGATLDKMERFFSAAMQKSEMVNRMATGLSAYRLMLEKQTAQGVAQTEAEAAALAYAEAAIDMTQGDYSNFNAPTLMTGNWMRVFTQFRKFQLIQATYLCHMFREAFLKGGTSVEKRAARLAFGYAMLHTAAFAGVAGLPLMSLVGALYGLTGDDEDPADLDADLRDLLGGGKLADMLMRGGFSALGVDISGNVGMRDVFDPLGPFTPWQLRNQGDGDKMMLSLAGPSMGQWQMWMRGMDYFDRGDTLRGVENFLPKGGANLLRAYRMGAAGIPGQKGDVWLSPDEVNLADQLAMSLGFRTIKEAQAQAARQKSYELKDAWSRETTRLKSRYVTAFRDRDYAALAEIREAWAALQTAKRKNGSKPSPLSSLLRAPQEAGLFTS
ncbi:MAG: PLxRFG domain-containing protein [Zoogloeaceae bacterium]|nr:PLxRFG domain-containing protein [Zoogloeaceae bacterium]